MILVFDLDDTLYPEREFVRSQFRQVADMLQRRFGISSLAAFRRMNRELAAHGRGKVFDALLHSYALNSPDHLRRCLSVYRRSPA